MEQPDEGTVELAGEASRIPVDKLTHEQEEAILDVALYLKAKAESHVREVQAKYGRHSINACPPHTRAMCKYAHLLRRRKA